MTLSILNNVRFYCFFSHITPEHQAVYTSTDSSVVSPPMRHTPVEPMSDQKEIQIPPIPYQPTISRPPSAGLSNRPYPYTSKIFDLFNSIKIIVFFFVFQDGHVSPIRDPY